MEAAGVKGGGGQPGQMKTAGGWRRGGGGEQRVSCRVSSQGAKARQVEPVKSPRARGRRRWCRCVACCMQLACCRVPQAVRFRGPFRLPCWWRRPPPRPRHLQHTHAGDGTHQGHAQSVGKVPNAQSGCGASGPDTRNLALPPTHTPVRPTHPGHPVCQPAPLSHPPTCPPTHPPVLYL